MLEVQQIDWHVNSFVLDAPQARIMTTTLCLGGLVEIISMFSGTAISCSNSTYDSTAQLYVLDTDRLVSDL